MFWRQVLFSSLLGYLLGSIPVGYLIGKLHGVDIRMTGSGRTGGTNVLRSVGLIPSAITILGDALKGMAAVALARLLFGGEVGAVAAGITAVAGHNWSVFLGMKGGAGGVTAAAILATLNPLCGGAVALIAVIGFVIWRYASVASLLVALFSPLALLIYALLTGGTMIHVIYGVAGGALIVVALLPNISRLIAGTERAVSD